VRTHAWPPAYVPNEKSGTLSVIDTASARRLNDITVGQLPWGVLIR
jgi:YVTN family beta-propeller protein